MSAPTLAQASRLCREVVWAYNKDEGFSITALFLLAGLNVDVINKGTSVTLAPARPVGNKML